MRTRFLATDCSTTASTAGCAPVEALDFVCLPLPHLPLPIYPPFSANFLQSFDEIPVVDISLEIEKLPIDDSISIFLSDVLPHFINGAGFEEPRIDVNKEKHERSAEVYNGEKELDRLDFDKMESGEKDRTTSSNKGGDGLVFVQFEIPEMDISLLPLKSGIYSQIEFFDHLSEVPEAQFTMNLLNSELTPNDLAEIQQSLYSVADISVEYSMDQKADLLDDADSFRKNIKFPLFEVDMESLGVPGRIYVMDELLSFENIEKQQMMPPDGIIDNNKELLGSMEFDWIKYLFHHSVASLCLQDRSFSSQSDIISIIEILHCQEYSTRHGNSDDCSIWSADQIMFDEFMFIDLDPYNFCEEYFDSSKNIEAETCEYMFGEAMNFRTFSQLIVSHELTLMDDSFKSLPVPILSDQGNTSSLHALVEELLAQLDWQSSSASDGLYLDWHFLRGDDCESAKYSSSWKLLWELDTCNIDVNINSSYSGKLIFDFILSEGHNSKSNAENYDEILKLSRNDVSIFHSSDKADSSVLKNNGDREKIVDDGLLKAGVKNVPLLGESMSSDLEFFLNPRNHITGRENIPADMSADTNTVCQVLISTDAAAVAGGGGVAASNATTLVQQKWNVKMRKVHLSDNIQLLIGFLWKNFVDILEDDKELLQMVNQYKASNDLTSLYLPMERLRHYLQERIATCTYVNDDILAIAMLCAIKQTGFYLCYYGIKAAYLFLDKLSSSLECLKSRLSFLYNQIRVQNEKADKELLANHPSISVVKEILQTIFSHSNSKILVVSDQVFWLPLKRLLTSLKISCKEIEHLFNSPYQKHQYCEIVDCITDVMLSSDCCLVSHENFMYWSKGTWQLAKPGINVINILIALGFQEGPDFELALQLQEDIKGVTILSSTSVYILFLLCFASRCLVLLASFILEYGGSNVSSRISSICPKSDGLPTLYFLKVDVEDSNIAKALSHGVDLPKSPNLEMKRDLDSASAEKECKTWLDLEELLNTIPVMETYGNEPVEAVKEDEDCNMMPTESIAEGLESEQNLSCKPFGPTTVIIVNTRNFNEEMVISRRSTYQRILEMEQEGAQVVERDIGLSVDVIVSSSVCLTWYDCRNIGKKASAPDEAFSCLPLCVESVAASTLTSLSFAFSCCILIFEGECNFLCSIMESSDELYAAAASLGIEIQLFCSYSHEMTEEIILSCINVAAKLTKGVYPKMLDSESLAESFLTAFPSISPLSAHAILSSDAILGKFLELSNGGKSCALLKYQVPDESIALLSVISRYGELEDSKSSLTDCSSSLSVPDSENVQFKIAIERKKPKHTHKLYDTGKPTDDLFHMDSQKFVPDDQHDLPELSAPCNPWLRGSTELSKSEQFSLSFEDKRPCHTQDTDDDIMKAYDADFMKSKSSLHDFPLAKSLKISDDREKPWMPKIDIDCSPSWKSSMTLKNNFSRQIKATGILQGSSTGEIIDLEEAPAFNENFFVANSNIFSPILLDDEKDYAATKSRMNKRPSGAANLPVMNKRPSGAANLPIFTNPTEVYAASGAWVSKNGKRQLLRDEITPSFDTTRSFGGTQLTNALHSTQPQGSPWTIEFLNRIREKSRLRKQSVSYDLSSPSFGSSGNMPKVTKRKSPSILEFYKYEGGNTPQKVVEGKRLKRISQPLISLKSKKASASCPSLTPIDKRAGRALSFSTNGSGGQSKLVWRDKNHQTSQRRL